MDFRFWKKEQPEESRTFSYTYGEALQFLEVQNRQKAMNISAVYRAVEIISDSIAILPVHVKMLDNKNCKSINHNHPVEDLFQNELGDKITRYQLMKLLLQSVMLKGNGFAYIQRINNTPIAIKYLEPTDVSIHYNKQSRELYYIASNITSKKIEPCDMIHFVKNSYDGVNGVSVLSYANRSIALAQSAENGALSFYSNGCNLAGILTVQGQLTEKQKQDIRSSWGQAYGNGGQGLAVLQGNMSYSPVQLSASDSQMLETRNYNVQDIARFFGISPVLLGDLSHSSYSTIEATQQQFLLHTLQPYITMIEEEFTRKLLKPSEREANMTINLDETALLRTDKTAMASYYTQMLNSGVMCVNEVRKELGLGEIEGGDKHIIAYTKVTDNTINAENTNTVNEENL